MSSVHAAGSATETQTQTLDATPAQVEQPTPSPAAPDGTLGDGVAGPSTVTLDNNGRVNGVEKAETATEPTFGPGPLQPGEGVVAMSEVEHIEGAEAEREQGAVIGSDESGQWTEEDSHELKRVKVYELIGSRWVDQGTAFCFGDFQDNEALLIARAEADFSHVILSTTIRTNDVYQRQQDTLIVWTEPDGIDYALSFQDPEGCAEVWHFIQEVQRHMSNREDPGLSSSPVLGPEPLISTASIIRSGHLPPPQLGIIGEIERAIKSLARTNAIKERICEYIQTEDYIKAMINVMSQAEDLESLENLHALCSCMQTILMLNDHSLYEHILEDDIFFGVVGMLEYDPEFPAHKANYREFLNQISRFHQPVPLRDEAIQKKIHHTYRLQFLKDVVLARAIDDSTFNVLNSCIIFNQIDIINHVQNDPAFLLEVVCTFLDDNMIELLGLEPLRPVHPQDLENNKDKMDVDMTQERAPSGVPYPNGTTPDGVCRPRPCTEEEAVRAREIIFLIQQLCVMGKNVQLPARMTLFRALVDRGILFGVQWALSQPESNEQGRQMIAAAGEILTALLDHDLNGVRGHVLKQVVAAEREKSMGRKVPERETMLYLMCRVLVKSRDLAVQSQLGESLRMMLETQQDPPDIHPLGGFKTLQRDKDAPGVERFLDNFYKYCIETLFRPFGDIPEFKTLTEPRFTMSRERTNLFLYLCDLLSVFTLQHSFRSHFFILSSNIATRVASLLTARDKHLRLAAFRFFRACVKLNNNNMFNHFFKHDIFQPILDITAEESRRDTLLSASCQELFEYMRKENMKDAIDHCMTVYETRVRVLAENPLLGPRFHNFIRRWEMNNAPPPPEDRKAESPIPNGARRWGQGRFPEAEEEDYFNADDDEDVLPLPIMSSPPPTQRGNTLKRKRASIMRRQQPPHTVASPSHPLSALVAYDDNDDLDNVEDLDVRVPQTEEPPALSSPSIPRKLAEMTSSYFPTTDEPPASPRMSHKQIPPKPLVLQSGDEQDNLLEQLFNHSRPSSPSPVGGKPPELGAKRRRDDDDDELLERLATRSKRPSLLQSTEKENSDPPPIAVKVGPTKAAEEGPKKIKLKFSAVGAAVAASPSSTEPSPSDPGTKVGDNG
ncbi:DUF625-domain-containing protein [Daedalea quercina L-15889]|uniref:DUF625-domain-containing protein n=1 Tax=Daedalea quercina L-15889 TaxID=1314783 RepID=A0A165R5G3_9APHY|nr:DUF625-domain-containing protein [Daedalea quercina L-15889]